MNPFGRALDLAFAPAVRRSVEFANRHPDRIKALRRRVIKRLRKLSGNLQQEKSLPAQKLDAKGPACSLNIPLIMMLTQKLMYSDVNLPIDPVYGMGISGKIEAANSLARLDALASKDIESAKHLLSEGNRSIVEALSRAKDQPLKQK